MTSYSNRQFLQDWRYAIAQDFTTPDGPFPYAKNGHQSWGDEIEKITFGKPDDGNDPNKEGDNPSTPHDGCVSADGRYLAIATARDVHVIDTGTLETIVTLQGHVSRISSLAFHPTDSNILVSSEEGDYGRVERPVSPTVYIWDIEKEAKRPRDVAGEETLQKIGRVAAHAAAQKFADMGEELTGDEIGELAGEMVNPVSRIARKHAASGTTSLHGRLTTSFQSEIFSPSGKWMVYLPGPRPRSNDTDDWVMHICSTDTYSVQHTLHGHTDAIMWTGWSPDESFFASVSWDKTVRVWDTKTYQQLYKWETSNQNWTAGFSKDSRLLAATCGDGTISVHDLSNGSTKWSLKLDDSSHWKRALDWHPDGRTLAVGGGQRGELLLLDVDKQEVLQQRLTSAEACTPENDTLLRIINNWVGVREVKFARQGRLLVTWLGGDGSVEVFDLDNKEKWRFARGGVDDGPRSHEWRDENGKVTSKSVWGMLCWVRDDTLRLASLDHDGVRVWSGPA